MHPTPFKAVYHLVHEGGETLCVLPGMMPKSLDELRDMLVGRQATWEPTDNEETTDLLVAALVRDTPLSSERYGGGRRLVLVKTDTDLRTEPEWFLIETLDPASGGVD